MGLRNCIIDCENDGRGFYFQSGEDQNSILSGFTIANGDAPFGAGIACTDSSSPTIKNCNIQKNVAGTGSLGGGGIACYQNSSPIISDCIIKNNSTNNYYGGGGISIWYSSPQIIRCEIAGNIGSCEGGGIFVYELSSNPKIYKCVIKGNISDDGGGIYTKDSTIFLESCIISENIANNHGGGIYLEELSSSSSRILNCLFFGNKSNQGAAIDCGSSSPTIINCTISNNIALYHGGAINAYYGAKISNSILWGNSPEEIYGDYDSTVSYSDINGGYIGNGNLNSDPQFISETDYHLAASSPCIDTGTSNGAPNIDIDGNPRPQGNGFDMGAYESDQTGGTRPSADAGPKQSVFDSITLDGSGSTDPDGTISSYLWSLKYQGNSSYDRTATGVNPTVSNLQPGFYDVTLKVTDNQGLTGTDTMIFSAMGINCDFNGDGDVDGSDLQVFSTNYGK